MEPVAGVKVQEDEVWDRSSHEGFAEKCHEEVDSIGPGIA